jgi:hypothetical protein
MQQKTCLLEGMGVMHVCEPKENIFSTYRACLLTPVKTIPTHALFIKTINVLINSACVGTVFTSIFSTFVKYGD